MNPRLGSSLEVDRASLADFLRRSFPPAKAGLLVEHGAWRHRGGDNQMVLLEAGDIVGYCGVVPVDCRVGGEIHPALWWIDLVIDPAHRGRGLQAHFDRAVRHRRRLQLGFPNALAADIHRHHGWGVREDFETLLLPLEPRWVNPVVRARGARRSALLVGAGLASPLAAFARRRLAAYEPVEARRVERPDPSRLAALFAAHQSPAATTVERDEAYLAWRYFDCPWAGELAVYVARDRLAAVVRTLTVGERRLVRILDLFGDLADQAQLTDILRAVGGAAARAGAAQVTLFSSQPSISAAARRAGFRLPGTGRFCWYSPDVGLMRAVGSSPHHWVLGDSDHDEPVDLAR